MKRVEQPGGVCLIVLALAISALAVLRTTQSLAIWGLLFVALLVGGMGIWLLAVGAGSPALRAGLRVGGAAVIVIGIVVSFFGGAVEGGQGWLLLVGILLVFAGIAAGARAGALGRRAHTQAPPEDRDDPGSGHGQRWDRMKGGD